MAYLGLLTIPGPGSTMGEQLIFQPNLHQVGLAETGVAKSNSLSSLFLY